MTPLATVPRGTLEDIPLDLVDVGDNVRVNIAELEELTASIREHGVLQPVKVVAAGDRFRLVWGQRRVLAARLAGLERIPAILEYSESEGHQRSIEQLVENLHRADLNPVDRARAMRAVVDAGVSQADLARQLGIAPSTVANDLGILEAPSKVLTAVLEGKLTAAHAKAMKGLAPKTQEGLVADAVRAGWSAHEVESRVQGYKRSEEYAKQREADARKEGEAKRAKLAGSLDRIQKRIPKDQPVYLRSWYGEQGPKVLAELLKTAGYTAVRLDGQPSATPRKDSLDCDCVGWQLETNYGGVTIREACTDERHRRAKAEAEAKAYRDGSELRSRIHAKLAEVLVDQVAAIGLTAARVALWEVLGWNRDGWAKARDAETGTKRRKRDPWASIVEAPDDVIRAELAKYLASSLSDHDFKVGWTELASELGVEVPT